MFRMDFVEMDEILHQVSECLGSQGHGPRLDVCQGWCGACARGKADQCTQQIEGRRDHWWSCVCYSCDDNAVGSQVECMPAEAGSHVEKIPPCAESLYQVTELCSGIGFFSSELHRFSFQVSLGVDLQMEEGLELHRNGLNSIHCISGCRNAETHVQMLSI